MTSISTKKQKAKAFGLSRSPPRCGTCKHFAGQVWAQPDLGMAYQPPRCELGGFLVKKHHVCDMWESRALSAPTATTQGETT